MHGGMRRRAIDPWRTDPERSGAVIPNDMSVEVIAGIVLMCNLIRIESLIKCNKQLGYPYEFIIINPVIQKLFNHTGKQ